MIQIHGWVELDGVILSHSELEAIKGDTEKISRFGGEFCITWNDGSCARDQYGVMLGECPAGTYISSDETRIPIAFSSSKPTPFLSHALKTAVLLRADTSNTTDTCVTALSGGVDSALIAAISRTPCIAVGMEGSHDLIQAARVASLCDIDLYTRSIYESEIKNVLPLIIECTQHVHMTPVDIAIGVSLWFICETAKEQGYTRILSGQRADEIFGGYHRYANINTQDEIAQLFKKDWSTIPHQNLRDQTVAKAHGCWLSMPYLDARIISRANEIAPSDHLKNGIRKYQLRRVALHYLPHEIACHEKKAMQYGTGIANEIKKIAKQHGFDSRVSEYLTTIQKTC
ncbi:MAG: asparagine synthase C-terminal domain-containing protein [Methanomicrobiales archaeon]|jgi:asparagine synthase (glutamine-hydrolysing)|nr:asparagine synthase C-terminal domain-containing protein [Methanomicrobiales archaeon]